MADWTSSRASRRSPSSRDESPYPGLSCPLVAHCATMVTTREAEPAARASTSSGARGTPPSSGISKVSIFHSLHALAYHSACSDGASAPTAAYAPSTLSDITVQAPFGSGRLHLLQRNAHLSPADRGFW